jgi:hypothetical protein
MSDVVDRLKARCWPLDCRDELCMDAVYVITDLRERLAAAESKEVCTVAHSDEVMEFCPYCKIEYLRARLEGFEFLLSDPGAKSLYWAGVAVANAIHAGLGAMIKGTDMERELRDVLWLRDGELRDVPKKTTSDRESDVASS